MLQMTKKLNWKRTVQHQGYLNREIPAKMLVLKQVYPSPGLVT